jgi:hypothetical protein
MKHSQTIGIIAVLILAILCFMPWSYIASRQLVISGMHAEGTNFGKPGLFHLILAANDRVISYSADMGQAHERICGCIQSCLGFPQLPADLLLHDGRMPGEKTGAVSYPYTRGTRAVNGFAA